MDNRNEPTDMDLIDSPRRTPTPPPLSACEQILQTKSPAAKDGDFQKFKLACIAELQAMPDHHPDEPFYRRAVSELQEVEETINLAVVLKGLPRNFKVEEIQADLEELGFTPENLINPNQYGFTNKLSTLHPLLRLTESISGRFPKRRAREWSFWISRKPSTVFGLGLTFKLITYDIPSPLIHLIHSYLTNRSFRIRVNESLSNSHSISAGCPQGSLLGPLLFNLYINDIPSYSLTNISLYADDTAINATYKNLKTVTFAINKHLKLLENYYDRWKISINVEKSCAVIFTKKRTIPPLS
ncbi:probable RNA-directed DNA polymerase from transposon X-element [Trichonephila clavipes]|nr:probable RNA-directed DNA polymerase from transposon X-element [Trichonephila clavipes]